MVLILHQELDVDLIACPHGVAMSFLAAIRTSLQFGDVITILNSHNHHLPPIDGRFMRLASVQGLSDSFTKTA
jgi:NADPH-dependent ferric siderophore reductase